MLKIDGYKITMEGPFNELVKDAARLLHALAKLGAQNFAKDHNIEESPEIYKEIISMVKDELDALSDIDSSGSQKVKGLLLSFDKELQKKRQKMAQLKHKDESSNNFIDYDTSTVSPEKAKNHIRNIIKKTYNDSLDKKDKKG